MAAEQLLGSVALGLAHSGEVEAVEGGEAPDDVVAVVLSAMLERLWLGKMRIPLSTSQDCPQDLNV